MPYWKQYLRLLAAIQLLPALESGEETAKTTGFRAPAAAPEHVHQHTRDSGGRRPGARRLMRRQYLAQDLIK